MNRPVDSCIVEEVILVASFLDINYLGLGYASESIKIEVI